MTCFECQEGATPLEYAASKDHFEVVRLLLLNGADMNKVNQVQQLT